MASPIDIDPRGSAACAAMIEHLTGPAGAGARETDLVLDGRGRIAVDWPAREAVVIVTLKASLQDSALEVEALLDPDGAGDDLAPLRFAPYTEGGAALALYRPPTDPVTEAAPPFVIRLRVRRIPRRGPARTVPLAETADHVAVRVVEGNLGRLLLVLGDEKSRLRRESRLVAAMRTLSAARGDALDRLGAEVGVPRFTDEIAHVPATATRPEEIVARPRPAAGGRRPGEGDDDYRRRIAIYRPFLLSSPARVLRSLNGEPGSAAANGGALGELGVVDRFRLIERDTELAVAVHLVETSDGALRDEFLRSIKRSRLVWPGDSTEARQAHRGRFLPAATKERETALRRRLAERFVFPASAALAPALAIALDVVGRCRLALGQAAAWTVTRAQSDDAGSRYELGLGADLELPAAGELDSLAARVAAADRAAADDPEIEQILGSMTPRSAADDPDGRWLLEPCGLRTVHRNAQGALYVSHASVSGLAIEGDSHAPGGEGIELIARHHAPGDPGAHVILTEGAERALEEWTAAGGRAWTVATEAQTADRLGRVVGPASGSATEAAFLAAELPAHAQPAAIVERLGRIPPELRSVLILHAADAAAITGGQASAAETLAGIVGRLGRAGIASALPLVTDTGEILLVAGAVGLPGAGANLTNRRATGFRWYAVPIVGAKARIRALGSRTTFAAAPDELWAVVCVGYVRRPGATDPYEMRVELPEGSVLDLVQYEYLMNLLDHVHPAGVEVNTFDIRQRHVDLDGDGLAEPLAPAVARTFRRFRRPRRSGPRADSELND